MWGIGIVLISVLGWELSWFDLALEMTWFGVWIETTLVLSRGAPRLSWLWTRD